MWDYAKLSKMAHAKGGPEALIKFIEEYGRQCGRKEMLPLIGLAAIGSAATTALAIKLYDYLNNKRLISEQSYIEAKEEIVRGINEYELNAVNKDIDSEE